MGKLSDKLEIAANALIIVASLTFLVFVGQRFIFGSISANRPAEVRGPAAGSKMLLSGFEFGTHPKTLLLVLSESCRYCTESMPFYKRMLDQSQAEDVNIVAVLNGNPDVGTKYLADNGISNIPVVQASLSDLNTNATPTVILTDRQGFVTRSWVGRLPVDKEVEVIDLIKRGAN